MLNSPKVTAVDYNGNLLNMAVFKVLCLIGCVLLTSGHIFPQRHDVRRFSRLRPALKRSERIRESSSAMWHQNSPETLIHDGKQPKGKKITSKVFLHLRRGGFDLSRLVDFLRVFQRTLLLE